MAAKSFARSVASGGTGTYSVPFGYLDKTHVIVTLDGVVQAVDTDYTWPTDATILFTSGNVPAGVVVERRRKTPTDLLVNFKPGNLSSADLNTGNLQPLYLAQEADDDGDDLADRGWYTKAFGVGGTIEKGSEGQSAMFDASGNLVPGYAQGDLAAAVEVAQSYSSAAGESATTASTKAGIATTQAGIATDKAGEAAQSVVDAQAIKDSLAASVASKADKTTTITGTGLASGGGSLAANRTITVTKAALSDYAGGTEDAKAVTPFADMEAIAKRGFVDSRFQHGVAFWQGGSGAYSPAVGIISAQTEGNSLTVTGSNPFYSRALIPVDPSRVYRFKVRVRQMTDGDSSIFRFGPRCYDKDGNLTASSTRYCIPYSQTLASADGEQVFEGYITGEDAATDVDAMAFDVGTRFIRLLVAPNYGGTTGVCRIIEVCPPEDVTHLFTGGGERDVVNMPAIISGTGKWKLSQFKHGAGLGVEANDTAALANMISEGETNIEVDPVEFKISAGRYALNPGTKMRGAGKKSVLHMMDPAQNVAMLRVANDVRLEDFVLRGPQDTVSTYLAGQHGIDTGDTGLDIERVRYKGLEIYGFAAYGVNGHRMKNFRSVNNNIHDVGRAGYLMVGGDDCKHFGDRVKQVSPGAGGVAPLINAYGFSYGNDGAAAGFPVPKNISFHGCHGEDIGWTCFDAHAVDGFHVIDCTTRRVINPIYFGPSSGTNNDGANNWSVIGGVFDATGLTYTRAAIIAAWSTGNKGGLGGRIMGPTIIGHGLNPALMAAYPSLTLEGAIHVAYQAQLSILNPIIRNFNQVAICLRREIEDCYIGGHNISGGNVATDGRCDAILVAENQNIAVTIDKGIIRRSSGATLRGIISEGTGLTSIYGPRVHKSDMIGVTTAYAGVFHADSTAP